MDTDRLGWTGRPSCVLWPAGHCDFGAERRVLCMHSRNKEKSALNDVVFERLQMSRNENVHTNRMACSSERLIESHIPCHHDYRRASQYDIMKLTRRCGRIDRVQMRCEWRSWCMIAGARLQSRSNGADAGVVVDDVDAIRKYAYISAGPIQLASPAISITKHSRKWI